MKPAYQRTKRGYRKDLGFSVRSGWEANYARYLKWRKEVGDIAGWEYEPDTFWFSEWYKRGTLSYLPDFKVTFLDGRIEYHEVKGFLTPKAKTQLKRMAKRYPGVKVELIDSNRYYAVKKQMRGLIKNWE